MGSGLVVCSLVETALVAYLVKERGRAGEKKYRGRAEGARAYDFAGVERGPTPARGLCSTTVETLSTEILSLL